MTTPATRNVQERPTEGTLFVAFELSEKPGSSASPQGMVKSRASALCPHGSRSVCLTKSPTPNAVWVCLQAPLW